MSEASESRERILVVDDNEMNRDMLSRRLQRKGYHVDTAIGGREALEALAAESYDLVLLDIMMPDVDGFQVLESARRQYDATELPTVSYTHLTLPTTERV